MTKKRQVTKAELHNEQPQINQENYMNPQAQAAQALPEDVIEITTSVARGSEKLESKVRINVTDLANLVRTSGQQAANDSIGKLMKTVVDKINESFKTLVNK